MGEDFMNRRQKRVRLREIARQHAGTGSTHASACFAMMYKRETSLEERRWPVRAWWVISAFEAQAALSITILQYESPIQNTHPRVDVRSCERTKTAITPNTCCATAYIQIKRNDSMAYPPNQELRAITPRNSIQAIPMSTRPSADY